MDRWICECIDQRVSAQVGLYGQLDVQIKLNRQVRFVVGLQVSRPVDERGQVGIRGQLGRKHQNEPVGKETN